MRGGSIPAAAKFKIEEVKQQGVPVLIAELSLLHA